MVNALQLQAQALSTLTENLKSALSLVPSESDVLLAENENSSLAALAVNARTKAQDAIRQLEIGAIHMDALLEQELTTASDEENARFSALYAEHTQTFELLDALHEFTESWTCAPETEKEFESCFFGVLGDKLGLTQEWNAKLECLAMHPLFPAFDEFQWDASHMLFKAVDENYVAVVKFLVVHSRRVDFNAKNKEKTALMIACSRGRDSIVRALISLPAERLDVNAANSIGTTALMMACIYGRDSVVHALLSLSAERLNVNARHSSGKTALVYSCAFKHEAVACALLSLPADRLDVNAKDNNGHTALIFACCFGDKGESIARVLLSLPATRLDLNAKDNIFGWTALMWACYKNVEGKSIVRALLSLTAENLDVNAKDNNGRTALMLACEKGYEDRVRALISVPAERLDVNAQDIYGFTALMLACLHGPESVVDALLSVLAERLDVNARHSSGKTALMYSCMSNQEEKIALVLLSLSAERLDVNAKDNNGWTALMWVCYENVEGGPIVRAFLSLPAARLDVHARNNEGQTALMMARTKQNERIVRLLVAPLSDHFDISTQDTPLRKRKRCAA